MLPLALFIFGLGGPVKSVKCVQHPAAGGNIATQVCTVKLRALAALGDRLTLVHAASSLPASAETMWEFGRNGLGAGVNVVDFYESPETRVVGVRYQGVGKLQAVK